MKHHCLICNNKHPDILYPTREDGLRAKTDHEKAISILRKLFFLPPEVQDDLTVASYCFNCTTKLCQLQEVYDQIELCQATIVQSRREVEMSLIKASFMDQNCHDQQGQDDVLRTSRENDENGTNHTRKLLCNLIHYKTPSIDVDDDDDIKIEESDDSVQSKRTEFNENSSEEMILNDDIGHDDDEAGSGAGELSADTTGIGRLDEGVVENTDVNSCSSTTTSSTSDTDDIMVIVTDDINNTIDKNTSSHDHDEDMPLLFSYSAIEGGDEDEHMEEVDDGNGSPPLIDKFDQMRTLKRKATLDDLTVSDEINGFDSGFGEQLAKKRFQLIDDEKTRYLKRQCMSRKCLVVLQTLKSPNQVKHSPAIPTPTFTFNKKKGPGQGRGKANFSSPMKVTVSGDSTLVMDNDVNPTPNNDQQKKTEKGILVPADKIKTPNVNVDRRVRFRSPISSIKTFTSEPDIVNNNNKLKGKQGLKRKRKINVKVKLVGKNLIRSRKSKITPVLKSYKPNSIFFNDDTSFNAQIQTQNSENESASALLPIPNSRATAVMEKIRNSEALLKAKLNFRRTVPVKKRKKKVKSTSTSASTSTLSAKSPGIVHFCQCGKEFKMSWRYNNHLKLHPTHVQLLKISSSDSDTKPKPTVNNDKMCELCENPIASRQYKRHLVLCQIRSKDSKGAVIKKNKPKLGRQSSYDKLLQIGKNVKKAVGIRASFLSHSQANKIVDDYENENGQSTRVIPRQHNLATTTTDSDEHDDQEVNSNEIAQNNILNRSEPVQNSEILTPSGSGLSKKFEIYESPNISLSDFEDKTLPKSPATTTTATTDESSDGESPKSTKETKNDTVFRCPYTECELEVIGKADLIAHLKYHMGLPSNSNSMGTQNSKFRCPYVDCEVLSDNKATLIAHLKVHMEV